MNDQQTTNPDRIIPRDEFRKLTGISRTSEFRLQGKGLLPKRVVIGGRVLGYRESDYEAWLTSSLESEGNQATHANRKSGPAAPRGGWGGGEA